MPADAPVTSGLSTEAMVSTVADLVALAPRAPGTPGGEQSAAYVADRLRGAGLPEVWVEETPTYAWRATAHDLRVGGDPVTSTPVRHCWVSDHEQTGRRGTGPDGLTASRARPRSRDLRSRPERRHRSDRCPAAPPVGAPAAAPLILIGPDQSGR